MYAVYRAGDRENTSEFATPDGAFDHARKLSKMGVNTFRVIVIRSGVGLGSSVRALAWQGQLRKPRACDICKGTGTHYGTRCFQCDGEGFQAGEATP